MDKDLEWEELITEHIVQDEWIDFRRSVYRFPDGSVVEPYYSYSRRDYVVIVATDEEGNYICVRQYRQGIREVTTEFPAGGIERSDGREYGSAEYAEDALAAAKRELGRALYQMGGLRRACALGVKKKLHNKLTLSLMSCLIELFRFFDIIYLYYYDYFINERYCGVNHFDNTMNRR